MPRLESVHRVPHQVVVAVADDMADPPIESARARLEREVEVRRYLPVDPEHRIRAGMDEHLTAGVPLRVEVEPPLPLPARQLGTDIADEEVVREGAAGEVQAERGAQRVTSGSGAGYGERRANG